MAVHEMHSEPIASRFIWPAPDVLRKPPEPEETAVPLEITGLTELKLGNAVCSLSWYSIAVVNGLQSLVEEHGRAHDLRLGDFAAKIAALNNTWAQYDWETRHELVRKRQLASNFMERTLGQLDELALTSGLDMPGPIVRTRDTPNTHAPGSGHPFSYQLHDRLYLVDNRTLPDDI